jgi:hypothetical protein
MSTFRALYAESGSISIQDHLDTVHKARYVGKKESFSIQKGVHKS